MSSEVVAGREARDGGNKQENTPLIVSYKKKINIKKEGTTGRQQMEFCHKESVFSEVVAGREADVHITNRKNSK